MTTPTLAPEEAPATSPTAREAAAVTSLFGGQLGAALPQALRKLNPAHLWRSPVMFIVWLGSVLTTVLAIADPSVFAFAIAVWLWLTVIFGNLAEAVAEGRGKAQADSLRAARSDTTARLLGADGTETEVPGTQLKVGDRVAVSAGQIIPGDGDVVEGVASVDESAITGESAPVIREAGGDRSAVTGGTTVLSDHIVVKITAAPGETFLDRMIALVEGASRRKTPNEIALSILLSSLTIIFLLAVATLQPMATYAGQPQRVVVLVALLVCLIPTTIGALLSAIGIAGMDRLVRCNVLAMSGRAVEAAGDVSTLLLDKTGTITYGNRQASELVRPRRHRRGAARRQPSVQPGRPDAGGSLHRDPRAGAGGGRHRPAGARDLHRVHRPDPDVRGRPGRRARSARGPAPPSWSGSVPRRPASTRSSTASPPPAGPPSWSPNVATVRLACSAWSTSRTWSRAA